MANPITFLHEWCTKNNLVPEFETKEDGPTFCRRFLCKVTVTGHKYIGLGNATNKKGAQGNASKDYLLYLTRQGLLSTDLLLSNCISGPASNDSMVTASPKLMNNLPPKSMYQQHQTPNTLGEDYGPIEKTNFELNDFLIDESNIKEAERLDANATVDGDWTIDNAKPRLNQFMEPNKLKSIDSIYSYFNPKRFLHEWCEKNKLNPHFDIREDGPNFNQRFICKVTVTGHKYIGLGSATNKKGALGNASKDYLLYLTRQGWLSPDLLLSNCISGSASNDPMITSSPKVMDNLPPKSIYQQHQTPNMLGEDYGPIDETNFELNDFLSDESNIKEAERLDANATVDGDWTIDNAKPRLNQFMEPNKLKSIDSIYSYFNPKRFLHEWCEKNKLNPHFDIKEDGPNFNQRFICKVTVTGHKYIGLGSATNKKGALGNASKDYLLYLTRQGLLSPDLLLSNCISGSASNDPMITASPKLMDNLPPKSMYQQHKTPNMLGEDYGLIDETNFELNDFLIDESNIKEAERLDANATVDSDWTIDNAKPRLNQFMEPNKLKSIYSIYSCYNPKSFLHEWCEKNKLNPHFDIKEDGPNFNQRFICKVTVTGHKYIGLGSATNKKGALGNASKDYLLYLTRQGLLSPDLLLSNCISGSASNDPMITSSPKLMDNLPPKSIYQQHQTPIMLGEDYGLIDETNFELNDFLIDESNIKEEERLDANATVDGDWTIDNAKPRLNQFMEPNKLKSIDSIYSYYNPKRFLHEWCEKNKLNPHFDLKEDGPNFNQRFICKVTVTGHKYIGLGSATNKKGALGNASKDYLLYLTRQGLLSPDLLLSNCISGSASNDPMITSSPKLMDNLPPKSIYQQHQTPNMLGEDYGPIDETNFELNDFLIDESNIKEAERLDANATVDGDWTIDNAKPRLNQFMEPNKLKSIDSIYSYFNPKRFLHEWCEKNKLNPHFDIKEDGPNFNQRFICKVTVTGHKYIGLGSATNKKGALGNASKDYLLYLTRQGLLSPDLLLSNCISGSASNDPMITASPKLMDNLPPKSMYQQQQTPNTLGDVYGPIEKTNLDK